MDKTSSAERALPTDGNPMANVSERGHGEFPTMRDMDRHLGPKMNHD